MANDGIPLNNITRDFYTHIIEEYALSKGIYYKRDLINRPKLKSMLREHRININVHQVADMKHMNISIQLNEEFEDYD